MLFLLPGWGQGTQLHLSSLRDGVENEITLYTLALENADST